MTQQEWQDRLDAEFPSGANVTQVEDVPEDTSDSVSFLTPRLVVLGMEGDDSPQIRCFPATFEKDVNFTIGQLEPWPDGYLVTQVDPSQPQFLLRRNFSSAIGKVLHDLRSLAFIA